MYRPDFWPNSITILGMVDVLHSMTTGSQEIDKERANLYNRCLSWWVKNKTPIVTSWEGLLFELVWETLLEWKKYTSSLNTDPIAQR